MTTFLWIAGGLFLSLVTLIVYGVVALTRQGRDTAKRD